jgi:putative CocE/NonD family hydrolase
MKIRCRVSPRLSTAVLFLSLTCFVAAQGREYVKQHYWKQECLIPMRDGVRLFTEVYIPKDLSRRYPIMLKRTPYGLGTYGADSYKSSLGPSPGFTREGYIFVYQDIRGKFRSEGTFVHHRPYLSAKSGHRDTDEASDSYDSIEWLLENIPGHNGRVGQWGISYAGWLTVMSLIEPHPALQACSPQASPADQFIGDDYYHNGAFRLMYAFDWTWQCGQLREGLTETGFGPYPYGSADGYRFFLELGPIANVNNICFNRRIPMWNELLEHWIYDEYWQSRNVLKDLKNIRCPVLNVVGWFDVEDFYGPLGIYRTIETTSPGNRSILVIGPWSHGGWVVRDGSSLGAIDFGSETSTYFREQVELPFFEYYLKDTVDPQLPEALVFETGGNRWRSYDHWPPKEVATRRLYLQPGSRLAFQPPQRNQDGQYDSFISDPGEPVPYSAEVGVLQGHLWAVEDQRFATSRPDLLVYQTEVLEKAVTVAGPIVANLYVAASGADADWVVKVIDVYPEDQPGSCSDTSPDAGQRSMNGYQMLLAADVFRSKFRHGFSRPEPLVPGAVTGIEFNLLDKHHTFLKGHRIMVQIQSSWFPLIDRNPQTFVAIPEALEADFQIASHRVYHSSRYPSHLVLPLLE